MPTKINSTEDYVPGMFIILNACQGDPPGIYRIISKEEYMEKTGISEIPRKEIPKIFLENERGVDFYDPDEILDPSAYWIKNSKILTEEEVFGELDIKRSDASFKLTRIDNAISYFKKQIS